jgi:hypothetical protein
LNSKAVLGGTGKARDIDGGDYLFREDAARGLAEWDAGDAGGGQVLQDNGYGFIEGDEAAELLWHGRGNWWRAIKGLRHEAIVNLDGKVYPKRIKIPDKELKEINLTPEKFHGEWNYTIKPKENTKFT